MVGISTTRAASTCQQLRLTSRLLIANVWQWAEIWPASATKQNMILSSVSRKSLQFYKLLVNIVSHTPHKSCGYLAFESVVLVLKSHVMFSVCQNL